MKTITIDGTEYVPVADPTLGRCCIAILQRGWVYVGFLTTTDGECVLSGALNIRKWGTSKGLGELVNGPLADTVLDPAGTVRWPHGVEIATLDVDGDAWEEHLG